MLVKKLSKSYFNGVLVHDCSNHTNNLRKDILSSWKQSNYNDVIHLFKNKQDKPLLVILDNVDDTMEFDISCLASMSINSRKIVFISIGDIHENILLHIWKL